jgi:energy-coupling factor transport system ATP-binding protein
MEQIHARGIAVIMITHDMRLVQEFADRVVVMSDGRILFDGPATGLFDRDSLLRQANLRPTILHELLNAIKASGTEVCGEIRRTPDLIQALLTLEGQEAAHGRR